MVFCDIDDTLVCGLITDLMHIAWDVYRCELAIMILMAVQALFGYFSVISDVRNTIMVNYKKGSQIYFITARRSSIFTNLLLKRIFNGKIKYQVISLECEHPEIDKYLTTECLMQAKYEKEDIMPTALVIEDNKQTLEAFRHNRLYDIMEVEVIK